MSSLSAYTNLDHAVTSRHEALSKATWPSVPIVAKTEREELLRSMTRVIDIAHRLGIDAVVDAVFTLKANFLRAETEAERRIQRG